MITKDDLKNEDNLAQCECGSYAHNDHMANCSDGNYSCPECHTAWLEKQIEMYNFLLRELSDPSLSKTDVDNRIKTELSKLFDITPEEFDELGLEI